MSKRPTILVTGGAGYIGSHCCRALDAAGYQPVTYDNLSTGHRSFAAGALVVGDIADKATLARTFAEHEIVAVMHFAASSLVGESVADPQKYYVNNLAGTLSLLETMREAGCNRLVFSSTGAVYGNADSKALREDYPCAPINPYGASKWMIERVLADYRAAYGFGSFALRYFNAAGADPAGGIGELREVETHLIPRAMMALQGHVPDFAVFGDDYDTPDGTAIRDYIHVTDLAAAHVLALKLLLEGHSGGAFNLGTGNGFSVREILAAIAAETGREVPACRQAAATRRSDLSGRRSLRRTHDIELPSRAFRSGHDHPHRLGVAQEGAPAEDRRAGSRVRRGNLPAPQHPQSLCGNTTTPTLPRKRERESDALRKRSLGGL